MFISNPVHIEFKNIEIGRDFELRGRFFYKTGKFTAVSRTMGSHVEVNPITMVELVLSRAVLDKVKELLDQGEGGGLIGETIGFNQSEVAVVIRTTWSS